MICYVGRDDRPDTPPLVRVAFGALDATVVWVNESGAYGGWSFKRERGLDPSVEGLIPGPHGWYGASLQNAPVAPLGESGPRTRSIVTIWNLETGALVIELAADDTSIPWPLYRITECGRAAAGVDVPPMVAVRLTEELDAVVTYEDGIEEVRTFAHRADRFPTEGALLDPRERWGGVRRSVHRGKDHLEVLALVDAATGRVARSDYWAWCDDDFDIDTMTYVPAPDESLAALEWHDAVLVATLNDGSERRLRAPADEPDQEPTPVG